MNDDAKKKVAKWAKEKKETMKCPICNGVGTQEEKTKGYRKYLCWSCEGAKVVLHPFLNTKEKENE